MKTKTQSPGSLPRLVRRWRFIPKISLINYRKLYAKIGPNVFQRVFYMERFWHGRIILIGLKAFAIELDFRRDWIADMISPNVKISEVAGRKET